MPSVPTAVVALDVPPRQKRSVYPEPFASMMERREKIVLGDLFGLTNFGVNLTRIKPGGLSALRHAHTKQDEFIYVLSGTPTLITDEGEVVLHAGMSAGFKAGTGNGHHLVNRSDDDVLYLEVGDRTPGDAASYPDNDLQAVSVGKGQWTFTRKDGSPYG